MTPFRDLLRAELDARGMTIADLARLIADFRNQRRPADIQPTTERTVYPSLYTALHGTPCLPGARRREIGERLFSEICEVLGLEVALVPRGAKAKRTRR